MVGVVKAGRPNPEIVSGGTFRPIPLMVAGPMIRYAGGPPEFGPLPGVVTPPPN